MAFLPDSQAEKRKAVHNLQQAPRSPKRRVSSIATFSVASKPDILQMPELGLH